MIYNFAINEIEAMRCRSLTVLLSVRKKADHWFFLINIFFMLICYIRLCQLIIDGLWMDLREILKCINIYSMLP